MKRIFVISVSLFFLGGLGHRFTTLAQYIFPFGGISSELYAEERQPAEQPQKWESLSPEAKKFLLELGKEAEKEEKAEQQAVRNVSKWLQLVDKGKYKDACMAVYSSILSEDELSDCIDRLRSTRNTLGRVISRNHVRTEFDRSQSNLEITYATAFEKRKKTVRESILTSGSGFLSIYSYRIIPLDGSFVAVVPHPIEPQVVFITSEGNIVLQLFSSEAPRTVDNFLFYVNKKFYDSTLFHRVIRDFVIQGGGYTFDMAKKRTRPPIRNEADNGLKNNRGTIAMARTPQDPHSATSQFFINLADNNSLNFKSATRQGWGYAVFGEIIEGMEVVDDISRVPRKERDVPIYPIAIMKARRFE